MVYGVEIINGVVFVQAYDNVKSVPKTHIMKYPDELQDYLEHLTKGD